MKIRAIIYAGQVITVRGQAICMLFELMPKIRASFSDDASVEFEKDSIT
jgi:hypothetical protein